MHLVYPPPPLPPPKKSYCITIVFDFSWDVSDTQEKLETIVCKMLLDKQGELSSQ